MPRRVVCEAAAAAPLLPARRALCTTVETATPPKSKLFFPGLHFKTSSRLACGVVGLPNVGKSARARAPGPNPAPQLRGH